MTRKAATMPTPVSQSKEPKKTSSTPPTKSNGNGSSKKREITHQMIAERAYEIYISGTGGSPEENWFRAERELRGQ